MEPLKRKLQRPLAIAMLSLLYAAAIFILVGCVSDHGTSDGIGAGKSAGSLEANLQSIDRHADAILERNQAKGRDPVVETRAKAIKGDRDAAEPSLAELNQRLNSLARSLDAVSTDRDHWKDAFNNEWNHVLGGWTRMWLGWIFAISFTLWCILGVVGAFVAPHAWIGKTILNAMPLANVWSWIANKVKPRESGPVTNINIKASRE